MSEIDENISIDRYEQFDQKVDITLITPTAPLQGE